MENYTLQAGFPAHFTPPVGTFRLTYSDAGLEIAKNLGLDMTYLPLNLNTSRAELVEILWDVDSTEELHYRIRFGNRDIVLVVNPYFRWRVTRFLEIDG